MALTQAPPPPVATKPSIKTVAAMKRYLQVGVTFYATYLRWKELREPQVPQEPQPRTVTRVQTNGFWFTSPDFKDGNEEAWATFPKAKEARFLEDGVELLDLHGEVYARYRW